MSTTLPPVSEPSSLSPRDFLRVLSRRKMLLMVPWGIALVIALAAALLLPPVYFSETTLQLDRPQALTGPLETMVRSIDPEKQADLMRDQVQSTNFLRGVVSATGLVADPETRSWALKNSGPSTHASVEDRVEAFLIDNLRSAITIRRGKGDVFTVTVSDRRPDRARRFTEAIANQFVLASKAQQLEAVRATQEFSLEQQQIYKHKLDDSEARLEAFKRSTLAATLGGGSVTETNVSRARTLLDQAELDIEEQRQRLSSLRGQVSRYDPSRLSNAETNAMAAQLRGLERQIASAQLLGDAGGDGSARLASARKISDLEIQFTQNATLAYPDASPDVRDALVRYRLTETDLSAKEARRAYLAGQVGGYESRVVMSPDRDAQLVKLQQEVDNNRALYNSFLTQSASAQISEAFENARVSGRFVVLEPANLPRKPGKPNRPVIILLGLVLGGIVGVGSVLVAERQDTSMKNAEEVELLLGLPVLGAVPRVQELERSTRRSRGRNANSAQAARDPGLLLRLKTETPLGLEFRRIFLKLAKERGRTLPQKLNTLMMTSSTRGEGKTTTTACLAITLARELDQKILLVDFDLRSPLLHRALGLPSSSWGLAQMLAQQKFDERFIRSTVMPNLDFLAAGRSERPASELINSDTVEWFLHEARQRYTYVLMDTAPNLAVPDPLILGRAVDGVLYVIKAGQTVRKAAEYGVKVQREACDNILGVLMNDAGEVLPHYYGYHDAYGYTSEAAGAES